MHVLLHICTRTLMYYVCVHIVFYIYMLYVYKIYGIWTLVHLHRNVQDTQFSLCFNLFRSFSCTCLLLCCLFFFLFLFFIYIILYIVCTTRIYIPESLVICTLYITMGNELIIWCAFDVNVFLNPMCGWLVVIRREILLVYMYVFEKILETDRCIDRKMSVRPYERASDSDFIIKETETNKAHTHTHVQRVREWEINFARV